MRALSVAQMREADRRAIEDLGIPSVVLMNNAGAAVYREIGGGPVGIVCGKGNNGGDGYVVARLALAGGYETRVVHVGAPDDITGDARIFRDAFIELGGAVRFVQGEGAVRDAMESLHDCAVLVDALLGTGVKGDVRGDIRAAIGCWPEGDTIAADLPSGLNADTGEICGRCVKAKTTVTFQFAKRGFEAESAKPYLGRLVVADIGIPEVCGDDTAWQTLRGKG